tara:strand:+ start:3202 stop:4191 length:990 start_codon:yes stop_codon:yes gene_type:complete
MGIPLAMIPPAIKAGTAITGMGIQAGMQGHMGKKGHEREKELMNMQYQNQQGLNKQGHELQMDMWNKTNFPEQVAKLKEAGLNPALLYGKQGAGGTTTGSQGGGSASGGSYKHAPMMDIASMMKIASEVGLLDAQKEKVEAETTKTSGVDTEVGWATYDNIMQDTQNKKLEGMLTQQKTINMQLQNVTEIDRAEALIRQSNATASKIAQDTSIEAETREQVVKATMLANLEAEARILERKTNVKLSKAQMQNMIDNVLVARQNADANDDKNANEITRQALMKELKQMDIDQRWWEMWVKAGSTAIGDLLGLIPNVNKIFKTITHMTKTQ